MTKQYKSYSLLDHMNTSSYNKSAIVKPFKNRNVAEFFAGIGLMRLGLEQDGWDIVFANDIAPEKYQMYAANFPDASSHFVTEDIHKLNAKDIPDIELATASFPCNDLSLAGARTGLEGKQSSAFWGFIRLLEEMGSRKPQIVLLENVAGFLTSHGGRDFQTALLALNRVGYSVDAMIIDAERFVPQSRVRMFLVGSIKEGHGAWAVKEGPVFYESDLRPKALANFIFEHPEIAWNIRKVPALPQRNLLLQDIIEDLPLESDFWWDKKRTDYLINQMSQRHAELLEGMTKLSKWSFGTVFRRTRQGRSMAELRVDGLAGCLRTPRGGSGRQILIKAGYGQVAARLLTPRECARLMGADDFNIDVPLNQALFGFGDAVCVPAISWISKHYLTPLIEEIQKRPTSTTRLHSPRTAYAA